MSEQGKVRLSCESADTNWEIEWPQQKFWKGASAGRRWKWKPKQLAQGLRKCGGKGDWWERKLAVFENQGWQTGKSNRKKGENCQRKFSGKKKKKDHVNLKFWYIFLF